MRPAETRQFHGTIPLQALPNGATGSVSQKLEFYDLVLYKSAAAKAASAPASGGAGVARRLTHLEVHGVEALGQVAHALG